MTAETLRIAALYDTITWSMLAAAVPVCLYLLWDHYWRE